MTTALPESRAAARWGLAALMLMAFGCGSEIAIATVEGRVTKNGQPLADHWVRFTAMDEAFGQRSHRRRWPLRLLRHTKKRSRPDRVEIGTGGEIDGRGNEISPSAQILSAVVVFEDGENAHDFDVPAT